MKLSEAINAGAKIRPQSFGGLFGVRWFRKTSCALGAAFEAAEVGTHKAPNDSTAPFRGQRSESMTATVYETPPEWFDVFYHTVECPQFCGKSDAMYRMIPHVNDDHRWTREQIAEWVARIEAVVEEAASQRKAATASQDSEWPEIIEATPE